MQSPSWSSKPSKTSRSVARNFDMKRICADDTRSLSSCSQSSQPCRSISRQISKRRGSSTSSTNNSKLMVANDIKSCSRRLNTESLQTSDDHQFTKVENLCSNFLEPCSTTLMATSIGVNCGNASQQIMNNQGYQSNMVSIPIS